MAACSSLTRGAEGQALSSALWGQRQDPRERHGAGTGEAFPPPTPRGPGRPVALPGPPCPRPRPQLGAPRAQKEPGPRRGRRPCGYLLQQGPQEQLMAAAALRPLAHVGRRHQALAGAEVLRVHGRGATPGSPSAEQGPRYHRLPQHGRPLPAPRSRMRRPAAPPALPWWRPGSFRVLPRGVGLLRAAPRRRQPPSALLDRGAAGGCAALGVRAPREVDLSAAESWPGCACFS
ncbi:hypothetical protein LUU34_00135500 [Aix galericulata]|nr:hypothetical protein LUU34_00135500 [Aix galericulata]